MRLTPFCTDKVLELGIFAKIFRRPRIEEVFDAMAQRSLTCTQWNWACVAGHSTLPQVVLTDTARTVVRAAASSGVRIAAISATFNLIEPVARERGLALLPAQARAAVSVNCDLLTLCTGTRDRVDMWRYHPDNQTPEAWLDMIEGLRQASRIASHYGVRLAIEPETANVVCDAKSAERALRELGRDGDAVSIILDAANLYKPPIDPRAHPEIINDAVARLGSYISLAHAKDIAAPRPLTLRNSSIENYTHIAAGTGILPYTHYLTALLSAPAALTAAANGRRLPLILHDLEEGQVPDSVAFVRQAMEAASMKQCEGAYLAACI